MHKKLKQNKTKINKLKIKLYTIVYRVRVVKNGRGWLCWGPKGVRYSLEVTQLSFRAFWQPGSITNNLNCHDCHVFESNKYFLLLLYIVNIIACMGLPVSPWGWKLDERGVVKIAGAQP